MVGMWKCQGMLRAVAMFCEIWDVNSGLLSVWREEGIPNRGMILDRRIEATVPALVSRWEGLNPPGKGVDYD